MALGVINRDGGKTDEAGHIRTVMKTLSGDITSGYSVSQRGAGANMSVDIAIGDGKIDSGTGYSYGIFNDAAYNLSVTTSNPSNPRRDLVVVYIDLSQARSTGVANNTNGVQKIAIVSGTAAGSPVDPSGSDIIAAIGSNPYITIARIRIPAAASTITTSFIEDVRSVNLAVGIDGWTAFPLTLSYVSATTFTIPANYTTSYLQVGSKLKLTQTTAKYFYVKSATYSSTTGLTTVTVDGMGTYTLANAAITSPYFSNAVKPMNYPFGHMPYKFRAHVLSPQGAFTTLTWTTVVLGTEDYDTGSNFASNTFTAPIDGYYQFNAQGYSTNASGGLTGMGLRLLKNGTTSITGNNTDFDNNVSYDNMNRTLSDLVFLSAGDTVVLQALFNTSTAVALTADATWMSGYLASIN